MLRGQKQKDWLKLICMVGYWYLRGPPSMIYLQSNDFLSPPHEEQLVKQHCVFTEVQVQMHNRHINTLSSLTHWWIICDSPSLLRGTMWILHWLLHSRLLCPALLCSTPCLWMESSFVDASSYCSCKVETIRYGPAARRVMTSTHTHTHTLGYFVSTPR